MIKRNWMVILAALVMIAALSACGSSQLAEDLTPIPTLPPGEEPALIDALAQGVTPAEGTAPEAAPDEANDETAQEPDLTLGEQLFAQNGCAGCHGEQDGVGPALTGMGDRAVTHAQNGQTPEEYLVESIVAPCNFIVDRYSCIMGPYDLTDHELGSLVAWLMTHSEGSANEAVSESEPTEEAAVEPTAESEAVEEPTPADADAGSEAEAPAVNGDAANGEVLFTQNGCMGCHGEQDGVGPALAGMGERASAHAQDGQTPEEYLHVAIVAPCDYIVDGYQCIMQPYDLPDEDLNDLVAYLLEQ